MIYLHLCTILHITYLINYFVNSSEADGMPKKSTSLLFSGDDIEAQKVGNNISAGGQGSDGGNKGVTDSSFIKKLLLIPADFLDIDDSCSVKQPLVKEEDAPRDRGGRLIRRQHLYNSRRVTCDYALAISIIGIGNYN